MHSIELDSERDSEMDFVNNHGIFVLFPKKTFFSVFHIVIFQKKNLLFFALLITRLESNFFFRQNICSF